MIKALNNGYCDLKVDSDWPARNVAWPARLRIFWDGWRETENCSSKTMFIENCSLKTMFIENCSSKTVHRKPCSSKTVHRTLFIDVRRKLFIKNRVNRKLFIINRRVNRKLFLKNHVNSTDEFTAPTTTLARRIIKCRPRDTTSLIDSQSLWHLDEYS